MDGCDGCVGCPGTHRVWKSGAKPLLTEAALFVEIAANGSRPGPALKEKARLLMERINEYERRESR